MAAVGLARASTPSNALEGTAVERGRRSPATNLDRLPVLDWSLWSVAKYYVEPDRVDPRRITMSALEALEGELAEVLVTPAGPDRVRVRVGTADAEFDLDVGGLWEVALRLREIYAFVIANTELDAEARQRAEFAMVDGVLETLDPHTRLLRPEALEEMNQSTKGSFGGLGIEVGLRDDLVTIIRVLDGTPAQAAGMMAGDRIVQVDEESTAALSLNDTVALLKGAPETEVIVYVRREGHADALRFAVTRAIITLDSVTADLLPIDGEDGSVRWVGLVQINRTFARTTGEELRAELAKLEAAGVEGLVLDMRQNQGGLLDAAVEVADAFLGGGTIVSTVGSADLRKLEQARAGNDFPELPIVVLIDEGSASATEIVAGALRNHDRALIVGRRSFGKGSVQVLYDRRVGDRELGLKLTRAQYLTPGEISIQSVGVSPDLETQPVVIGKSYSAYYGRRRFDLVREETLSQHLNHDTAEAQRITAGPLYFLEQGSVGTEDENPLSSIEGLEEATRQRARLLLADPEIRLARDLVHWAPSPDREALLELLPARAEEMAAAEEARIVASLAKVGVDWSAPPPGLAPTQLRVELSTDRPDNRVLAGEKVALRVKVTNTGEQAAHRVRASTQSDYGYYDDRELLFGRIEPGQSLERELEFAAANHEISRRDRVDLRLADAAGFALAEGSSTALEIGVEGRVRPNFVFGWSLIDDPARGDDLIGDGDGILEPGERARLEVYVQNRGEGTALDTTVRLRSTARSPLFLERGRQRIGSLPPQASNETAFIVELRREHGDEPLDLTITVADNKVGEYLSQEIDLLQPVPKREPPSYSITPPRVEVESLPLATDATSVHLRGQAQSDDPIRDAYVMVYNPARHPFERPQKIHYLANADPASGTLSFEAEVPLEPGNNLVEVYVRGPGDILGWSRHWVLRRSGLAELRAAKDDGSAP